MFDILVYLFEQYHDAVVDPRADYWARRLQAAGFRSEEIDEALDWLDALRDAADGWSPTAASRYCRCYCADEMAKLSAESRGFLLFLEQAGAISVAQRELILDRLMRLSVDVVDDELLKRVALMVLWTQQAPLDLLLVEELLCSGKPLHCH